MGDGVVSFAEERAPQAQTNLQSPLLSLDHVAYWYMRGTPLEVPAISDITITVQPRSLIHI